MDKYDPVPPRLIGTEIPPGWTRDSYYRYLRRLDFFRVAARKLRADPSLLETI